MGLLSIFATRTAAFRTPLSPEACEARLATVLKKPLLTMPGTTEPQGETFPGGARLWTPMTHRLSIVTDMTADFVASDGGTLVNCRSHGSFYDMVLSSAFVGMFLAIALGFELRGVMADNGWRPQDWVAPFYLIVAPFCFGVTYAGLRRHWARDHHERLLGYLISQLNGTPIEPSS